MALPKSGSRKITVDGVSYRYTHSYRNNSRFSLVIQGEAGNEKLHIHFPNGMMHFDQIARPILPGLVKKLISAALKMGWKKRSMNCRFEFEELLTLDEYPEHFESLVIDELIIKTPDRGDFHFRKSKDLWSIEHPMRQRADQIMVKKALDLLADSKRPNPSDSEELRLRHPFIRETAIQIIGKSGKKNRFSYLIGDCKNDFTVIGIPGSNHTFFLQADLRKQFEACILNLVKL